MTDKKIVVPQGGLDAAAGATKNITTGQWAILRDGLEAFCVWLSENPPKPDQVQEESIQNYLPGCGPAEFARQWIARMFLAPEPEVPEDIKDLMLVGVNEKLSNKNIIEAFKRGQKVAR
jgi:hypothetical protein